METLKELLQKEQNRKATFDVKLAINYLENKIYPPKELKGVSEDKISENYPILYAAKYDPETLRKDLNDYYA